MAAIVTSVDRNGENIRRKEVEEAIAEVVELRALHSALMQANKNTSHLKYHPPVSSPSFSRPSHSSAHDYPVFTPSYNEDEPLPGYNHMHIASPTISQSWDENKTAENQTELNHTLQLSNYTRPYTTSRNAFPFEFLNFDHHICPADDTNSEASSFTPGSETHRSKRRNSLGDFKSLSSCNKCKPAIISTSSENNKSKKHSNIVVPLTDSHATITASQRKSRGVLSSWFLPRFRRREKNNGSSSSLVRAESEGILLSIETLKKQLIDANQKRDSALAEVSEMKASFEDLKKKLETLESYCEDLKKALRQAAQTNSISKRNNQDSSMPVSEDVMIEGFLQIVSETRLSVKQFCKTVVDQIDEKDEQLMENLNQSFKPYKLSLNSKYSKVVFYHLEAMINQSFFQDFENCVFQKNGSPKLLDPRKDREQQFQSFAALRNLSWNEVLKKGTKYYSEEFSKFCDQKMSCIITTLNWNRPWPGKLLHSFFVAAKCIWLLHLLSFSFNPPLKILRVEENREFDPHYMEDVLTDKQKVQSPNRVKIMVIPGFYVHDKILRCKVLCRYKSVV